MGPKHISPPEGVSNYRLILDRRTLFLFGRINDSSIEHLIQKLLSLESEHDSPILLVINSGGGEVSSALSLIETMHLIDCPVHTLVLGRAASAAAVVSTLAGKGRRFICQNGTMMLHDLQLSNRVGGLTELEQYVRTASSLQQSIMGRLLETSKLTRRQLRRLMDEERELTSEEALKYGLVDQIVNKLQDVFPDEPKGPVS